MGGSTRYRVCRGGSPCALPSRRSRVLEHEGERDQRVLEEERLPHHHVEARERLRIGGVRAARRVQEHREHRDRERERDDEQRQRPHARWHGAVREVERDAEVDDDGPHAGDAQGRDQREALQAQRGERVGRADRKREERLVDAVDVDVGELVAADDEDVDAPRRDQRAGQVVQRRLRGPLGREHVEPEDGERRPNDRVRAREPPECDDRRGRGGPGGSGCRGAHVPRRSCRRWRAWSTAPTGTKSAPASEPAAKRAANWSRRRGVIGARARSAAGAAPAAGEAPAAGFTPTAATAYGTRRLRYQAGASGTSATSAKPARSIQARYSASAGNSIHVWARVRSSRLAGRTGPITVARPPARSTR